MSFLLQSCVTYHFQPVMDGMHSSGPLRALPSGDVRASWFVYVLCAMLAQCENGLQTSAVHGCTFNQKSDAMVLKTLLDLVT